MSRESDALYWQRRAGEDPDAFTSYDTEDPRSVATQAMQGPRHQPPESAGRAAGVAGQQSRPTTRDERLSAGMRRHAEGSQPRSINSHNSAVSTGGATTIIGLGGPAVGFVWEISRVNIGPEDYVAGAGTYPTPTLIILTKGQGQAVVVPVSGTDIVSSTTQFPSEGTWGRRQLVVLPGEHLRVIIVGGLSAGYTVSASAHGQQTVLGADEDYAIV